jgi:NADH-quinone oxidoreductase subunit M
VNLHLLFAAPFVAALLTFFLSGKDARSTLRTALVLALGVAGASLPLLLQPMVATVPVVWFALPGVGTPFQWALSSNGISAWIVALSAFLTPVVLLTARTTVGDRMREFAALVFLMQGLMAGAVLSGNLFLFYFFFEAMLIPATVLIALFGRRDRRRVALFFLVFSLIGSAPLFVGIWWLATVPVLNNMMPAFDWAGLKVLLSQLPATYREILFWAFALAFLVKLPVVPLHVWQADAYSEGPAAGSALLTGVMAKIGLYGFLCVLIPLFPVETLKYANVFVAAGLVTVLVGALMAYQQRELRRVLAFSSLSHLGLGLAAMFTFRPEATAGVAMLIVAHGLSAAALFLMVGIVERWKDSVHIDDFGGLASKSPVFSVLFVMLALAAVGLPGTAGFVAEFLLIFALFQSFPLWVAAIAGLTVILSAAYTLRLVQKVIFGKSASHEHSEVRDIEPAAALALVPVIVALVYLGFRPGIVLNANPNHATVPAVATLNQENASNAAGR